MNRKVIYPEWAERYRTKGHTIRKVRDGYGLYRCTSSYVKGSYPRSVQEYLGMITERDGFVPKTVASKDPAFVEFGLSRFILANYRRSLQRSSFNDGAQGDVITLGVIHYIFGDMKPCFIRATYLSRERADDLILRADGISPSRVKAVATRIGRLLERDVPDEDERQTLVALLLLCVIDPENPRAKPHIPDTAREIMERRGLRHG
jgi:hypothetical protein